MPKYTFELVDLKSEYVAEQINTYLETYIDNKLGGYADNSSYLLKKKYKDEVDEFTYSVVVAPAVDNDGQSKNVLSFLDKNSNPEQPAKKDIFDEIGSLLTNSDANDSKVESHIKILFPYNYADSFWMPGEIRIHRTNNDCVIYMVAHDPFGKENFSSANTEEFKKILNAKINSINNKLNIKFNIQNSPYHPRQNSSDNKSSGVITADDIVRRIQGEKLVLDDDETYEIGAEGLRKKQLGYLKKYFKSDNPILKRFIDKVTIKTNKDDQDKNAESQTVFERLFDIATSRKRDLKELNDDIDAKITACNDKYKRELKALVSMSGDNSEKISDLASQRDTMRDVLYKIRDKKIDEIEQAATKKIQAEIDKIVTVAVNNQINKDEVKAKRIKGYISCTTSLLLLLVTALKPIVSQSTTSALAGTITDALVSIIGGISAAAIGYVGVTLNQDANKQENAQKQDAAKVQSDITSNAALLSKFSSILSVIKAKGTDTNAADLEAALATGLSNKEEDKPSATNARILNYIS